jgi:hypothetical protein
MIGRQARKLLDYHRIITQVYDEPQTTIVESVS